jgi:acetyltransferase-like isoleucine patch superfamily enzyme
MNELSLIISKGIGPRTLLKSLRVFSKTKAGQNGRGIFAFTLNGSTLIHIEKNARIINKGIFIFGYGDIYPPTKSPCALQMRENSTLIINGKFSASWGVTLSLYKDATLEIGDNVWINSGSKIFCSTNMKIGNGSVIGWDVDVCDSDCHIIDDVVSVAPIDIGSHVWIGRRATILKGVKIGDGAVVAAGAVVAHNVPNNCLVGGVPARILRENVKWRLR